MSEEWEGGDVALYEGTVVLVLRVAADRAVIRFLGVELGVLHDDLVRWDPSEPPRVEA